MKPAKNPQMTTNMVTINIMLVSIAAIGVIISVLVYLDNKKHAKLRHEISFLDKEIKHLDLALKSDEAKKKGVL